MPFYRFNLMCIKTRRAVATNTKLGTFLGKSAISFADVRLLFASIHHGKSVNDGIVKNVYEGEPLKYTLPSILTLADQVRQMGRGTYMWKHDLARAYRQLRICPLSYPLLGIQHKGLYYIDKCPAFGCRVSGCSQQRVSESLCTFMCDEGHKILAYVDDFCGVSKNHDNASRVFTRFKTLCDE